MPADNPEAYLSGKAKKKSKKFPVKTGKEQRLAKAAQMAMGNNSK